MRYLLLILLIVGCDQSDAERQEKREHLEGYVAAMESLIVWNEESVEAIKSQTESATMEAMAANREKLLFEKHADIYKQFPEHEQHYLEAKKTYETFLERQQVKSTIESELKP